jgi:hypothetical protein
VTVLQLFDALCPAPTWGAWRAFVAAVYGAPMDPAALAMFQRHSGREQPRPGGYPEAVAIVGVQSGKSRTAAVITDGEALTGQPGTHALLFGQDLRGAMRVLLRYAREPFETLPAFRAEVMRETADTLELRNGVSLSAYPCRPAAARGLRACVVCIDELAFFTATDGRPTDTEMLRVARGRVATTGGKLIILSSPYAQSGALYELHRKHYGRDDSDTLIWQASAPEMNPTLSSDYLQRMEADDPEAYRSEVLGEFRAGVSTLFDVGTLRECVAEGVRERPRDWVCRSYAAHVDPASGGGKDAFALSIAHREGDRVVLDVVRVWKPPFNPSGAIAEAARLVREGYGMGVVQRDVYAPGFVDEGFRTHGIICEAAKRTTSEHYLEMVPLVNAKAAVLLDDPELLRELSGLERHRGPSGRDRVDHRPGAHDDRAAACAGALVAARRPPPGPAIAAILPVNPVRSWR